MRALLARVVSRRVRALETALDVQRAQTLTWRGYYTSMEKRRNLLLDHLRHAVEGRHDAVRARTAARAQAARYRLAYLSAAKRATLRRLTIAVLRAGLAAAPPEPPSYGALDAWPAQTAQTVEVWRRRALTAEANCARYEDRLAILEGRPVVVAR